MPQAIPSTIAAEIERQTGAIKGFSSASGGCINNGGRIDTASGKYFLKWNDRKKFPGMFAVEAKGLSLLRQANVIYVPAVIHVGLAGEFQFLVLEYIQMGASDASYWRRFGSGLAALHKSSATTFGLDHNNYIGSLRQENKQSTSWVEFFIEQRLKAQLELAVDGKRIDHGLFRKFDALFAKLHTFLPEEPPSLLHGDLWSGNIISTVQGQPCLIDPAVYYGHREMDLAMTQLFGGFDCAYLDSYNEEYPLIPGYEERLDLYNLYPLLVHVNLFGGGYERQVADVLRRFV